MARVWTETYRVMHPVDKSLTCCIDDLEANPDDPLEVRIDYIFLMHQSGEIIRAEHAFYQPLRVGEGWQWVSDHTGLMLEIEP